MLEQITQIKLALANVYTNMQSLLHEREQFIKEITRLREENLQLKKLCDGYKSNIEETSSEIPKSDIR